MCCLLISRSVSVVLLLSPILGRRKVRTEVEFIPAHLIQHTHYEHAYECLHCKKQGQNQIRRQKAPVPALQKSLAGPSVLAWNLYQKLEMGLPYHRQEKEWRRYGLTVSRRTLSNWSIRISEEWLSLIYEAMHNALLNEQVIAADETVYQILHREDGKPPTSDARIWLFRTSENARHPIILYHSSETRKYEVAEEFLKGFKGFLHCDGYAAYKKLPDVALQLCWAHVRRKFFETNDPYGKGAVGVDFCNQLFQLKKSWNKLSPEQRLKKRKEQVAPIVEAFWDWLKELETMKGSLQKAVTYAKNHQEFLNAFLSNGELSLSNNLAERSIRPVTVGRKNWYFSTSVAGARANAIGYSVIQTAKENGLEPYAYLTWLLKELPQADILQQPERIQQYLPWSAEAQQAVAFLRQA